MNITSKYRSLSVQAKAALWFTICSFLQKGISFITVPIFTRLMSTEEYGTYTVYLSWLQILTIMTSLYLFNGVYDNAMAKYEKQRDEYTSAMQGLTLVITGAVFALYCFTSGFWEKILNLPKSMILLMFLEALLSPALSYWSGRQRFVVSVPDSGLRDDSAGADEPDREPGADPYQRRYGHDADLRYSSGCRSASVCRLLCSSFAKGKSSFRRNTGATHCGSEFRLCRIICPVLS